LLRSILASVGCACWSENGLVIDIHPHPDAVQSLCDNRLLHQISNHRLLFLDNRCDAISYVNVGARAR
jgi:hypothetical protein